MTDIREQARRWRQRAIEMREEADRIRRTVKEATGAEERCYVRAEILDQCANELDALLREVDPPAKEEREMQHPPRPECQAEGWHLCVPATPAPSEPERKTPFGAETTGEIPS